MIARTALIALAATAVLATGAANAGPKAPTAMKIERMLEAEPQITIKPEKRVTIEQFKHRPDLRRHAPVIHIQAINFRFGSAEIPYSQFGKVEQIAIALNRMLRRNPDTLVLIEGHTDAVGSRYSNQILSQRRARSLRRALVYNFGIPRYALETVGYGEDFLLVPVPYEEWRNRRVTLRRADQFLR